MGCEGSVRQRGGGQARYYRGMTIPNWVRGPREAASGVLWMTVARPCLTEWRFCRSTREGNRGAANARGRRCFGRIVGL